MYSSTHTPNPLFLLLLFVWTITIATATLPPPNPLNSSFALPPPTGPHTVGTTNLILTDESRRETYSPLGGPRVILARIFYPTLALSKLKPKCKKLSRPGYLTPGLARVTEVTFGLPTGIFGFVETNSYLDAPVVLPRHGEPAQVIIFSPGYSFSTSYYQTYHEELASWGYVVIAIEHLYDARYVDVGGLGEFWNEYLRNNATSEVPWEEVVGAAHSVRVGDGVFILKSLEEGDSELVTGVERLLLSEQKIKGKWWSKNAKVAMYGHSLGGSTSAGVALENPTKVKLLGGINLDGTFIGPATKFPDAAKPAAHLGPFLVFGVPEHNSTVDESWSFFLHKLAPSKQLKWKVQEISLLAGKHATFSDLAPLAEVLRTLLGESGIPKAVLDELVGKISGLRAMMVVREVVSAWMGWVVRGEEESGGRGIWKGDVRRWQQDVAVVGK